MLYEMISLELRISCLLELIKWPSGKEQALKKIKPVLFDIGGAMFVSCINRPGSMAFNTDSAKFTYTTILF